MTGRSRELVDILKTRRIDIACVQETRWTGGKARDIGEGYKLYYYGSGNRNGVGVIVCERLRSFVVEVSRISDRLLSVKIDAGGEMLRVVSCYAPQANCSVEEKDAFWEVLSDHIGSFDPEERVAIGGDLNGHVGEDRLGYERYHGGRGFGSRNNDGQRILSFAEAHDLAVANTFFKKRSSHLITYCSGGRETQIDYWLVQRPKLVIYGMLK